MNRMKLLWVGAWACALSGCTTSQWYGAVQDSARYDCKHKPQTERERCEARTGHMSYEEYQKAREELAKSKEPSTTD